ncbi:TRAP transporter substrate-binding protein [Sedimentitalea sp. JM2-8]|uniref:TRAP transporter substrate-binding protein n=1 Tax=Sedimentitalea xiamensis TaxID=3050037 RepID=A0ABT7FIN8_9RHOB|nr:TRAP transporter substrate-binding protein [Sedimentitalea xiamensis]MDK3075001.1 TRAP transporter substrate-binding protein [Sedimentitalea xiamensis]
MKTLTTLAASALIAATSMASAEGLEFKALGQPVATGLIQKNVEQPFFENFAERTGINASVDYKPLDVTGIKDTEQLRILKAGLFDIVSLRMSQISRDDPTILGLDLVGLNPDYDTGRKTIAAFADKVDAQLQAKFNTKLLGVWPFGPQVLFCEPEIGQLADLKGKKVRVYDQNLANFVSSVGGTPVPIGFPDVHQSLARGVVDCAITGPSSANSAGWPEVTNYMLPVAFQLALNGYGMNLDAWNKLTPEDQAKLEAGFDQLVEEIWTYSEELFDDAVRCNVGADPCETVKKYDLTLVPVTDADKAIIGNAVNEISFPTWAEVCDKQNPTCSEDWKAAIGAVMSQ